MNNDDIIVMGCGASINNLTDSEKEYINKAKARIALNRFVLFYKEVGIIPTHIFFLDFHTKPIADYLQKCIDLVKDNEDLKDVTFIFQRKIKNRLYPRKNFWYHLQVLNPFNYYIIKKPRLILDYKANIDFVKNTYYLNAKEWADNFNEKLFHYRSSLTSVLNYCTIKFKPSTIKLIGVDLNNSDYFFEDKVDTSKDHIRSSYKKRRIEEKEKNKHFTVLEHKGTNMLDKFPYIVSSIKERGFEFYCSNKESLLVKDNFLPFKEVDQ